MESKNHIILMLFLAVSSIIQAQTTYFYYFSEKIFLDVDRSRVAVNYSVKDDIALDSDKYATAITEIKNRTYVILTDEKARARIDLKHYYCEFKTDKTLYRNQLGYKRFVNTLNKNPNIIKASPCYTTLDGNPLGLTNSFYVKLKPQTDQAMLYRFARKHHLEVLGKDKYDDKLYIVSCSKNNPLDALEYANLFYETGFFEISEPEFIYHIAPGLEGNVEKIADKKNHQNDMLSPNDPLYTAQWGLSNTGQYGGIVGMDINIEPAWNITKGANAKVAIFDHGFEMDHPDLANNVFGLGFDAETMSPGAKVRGRHGTPVAGIIGASQNNGIGMSGVAPESDIISISMRIRFQTAMQIKSGFDWASDNEGGNADVINCSWGSYSVSSILNEAIINAVTSGRNGKGCVVVFCSHNISTSFPYGNGVSHPAYIHPDIVVVGAMSPCAERKIFSPNVSCDGETDWGSRYGASLDVMAPGVKIVGTDNIHSVDLSELYDYDPSAEQYQFDTNEDYILNFNGSSSAAPQVSGVAALLLSVNPCLTARSVGDIIEKTARKVGNYLYTTTAGRPNGTWNEEMGYGLIDAYAAVVMAQNMYSMTLDLYVKDSAADLGIEPNTFTQNMWTSEDIWVRNQQDTIEEHQNPIYDPTVPNYIYVRVINKSCVASTGTEQLSMHWAKASSALSWPSPWTGGIVYPTTEALMGDFLSIQNLPVIAPGGEAIIEFPWMVPNPSWYGENEPWHFCLLAKIISAEDPMTFPELDDDLNVNVGNNNNIAWKNIEIVTINPVQSADENGAMIATGNPLNNAEQFSLTFQAAEKEKGEMIFEDAEVVVILDENLFKAWNKGGRRSTNMKTTKDENKLIITGDNAVLKDLQFDAKQIATVTLKINFLSKKTSDKNQYTYHVIQKNAKGDFFGGQTYKIIKKTRKPFYANAGENKEVDANQKVTIIAEDVNEPAVYNWYDSDGTLIHQGKELQITKAVAKKYRLEVVSTVDGFMDYTEVQVAIKPSKIIALNPNPSNSTVTVNYKLNEVASAYLMVVGYYETNGASNSYILDINSNQTIINISNYKIGYYSLSLVCDGQIIDVKTLIRN